MNIKIFSVLILAGLLLSLSIGVSGATWCDSDLAKRINVSVNNTAGSALTDYQVYVNLSSNPINETSLRVYNATSCTLRPHWTENETGGNSYGVWINYSAIAVSAWTNNTAIYYDNVAASSVSNGDNTFEFFDDMDEVVDYVQEDVDSDDYANYPGSAVEMPNGSIWMFYSQGDSTYHDWNGDFKIKYRISTDDGVTWGASQLFYDTANSYDGEPIPYREGNTVYLFWTAMNASGGVANDLWMRKTINNGTTWTDKVKIWGDSGVNEKINTVQNIIKHGSTYILSMSYQNGIAPNYDFQSYCIRSTDIEGSWTKGNNVDTGNAYGAVEPCVVELSNGDIYMDIRSTGGHRWKAVSTNDGATWGTCTMTSIEDPRAQARLLLLSNGHILFTWNNDSTNRYPLTVGISTDDLATFDVVKNIKTESGTNQLSNMGIPYELSDGTILFGYGHYYSSTSHIHLDVARFAESDLSIFKYSWDSEWSDYTADYISSPKSKKGYTSMAESGKDGVFGVNLSEKTNMPSSGVLELNLKDLGSTQAWFKFITSTTDDVSKQTNTTFLMNNFAGRGFCRGSWGATFVGLTDCQKLYDGNWHKFKVTYTPTSTKIQVDTDTEVSLPGTSTVGYPTYLGLSDTSTSVENSYLFDNLFLRKYASSEPSSSLGSEEGQAATTPVISNVQNGSISSTSQYVDWDVNQTAHNRVLYSNQSDLTPAWYSTWDNATAAPNITLSALTASTQYWYQAWSYNTTNTSLSDNSSTLSFTTTNTPLNVDSVILNSTFGTNFTNENLTAYPINVTPSDAKVIYNWKVNGDSIKILDMPMDGGLLAEGGTKVRDYINGYNGSVSVGGIYNATGGYDGRGVYDFITAGKISIPNSGEIANIGTVGNSYSLGLWVYTRSDIYQIITHKGGASERSFYFSYNNADNSLRSFISGSGVTNEVSSGSSSISLSTWYYVVMVVDRENNLHKIYLNSELKNTGDISNLAAISLASTNGLYFGRQETDHYPIDGKIDEIKLFKTALTDEQVLALYNNRTDLIVSQETRGGENWSVCGIPNDNVEDGGEVCSNTVTILNSILYIDNAINIKEDWGRDFNSNLSANVTGPNASNVWMNFSNAEFTNTSLGWLNLTLDEWVNESHNVNAHVTNVSVTVFLNASGATNDSDSFYYEITNRTNTATMDSTATQNVDVSESFYINATCNEEYGDTFYGAANLLEDGAIVATNSSVTDYVNFSHSESSTGVYNYTVRFYNLTHYDNATTPTYSNVTVSGAEYKPPDATTLANSTGNYYVNYTWVMGVPGNVTDSYNVSWNLSWYNNTLTTYMQKEVGASNWGNITVYAFNSSGNGTLSSGSISDNVQAPAYVPGDYIPSDPTTLQNTTENYWVNYTWITGGGVNATDSYNVSWNLTWYNTTLVTYMNDTVGEFNWANISVWAYNSTGNGSLSPGSVSDNTQAGGGAFTTSMTTTVYNLITYYGSTTSTAEQFGNDIGNVTYVAMYNGSFVSHTMTYVLNNFTVYHGIGYYVYLNASGSSAYQRNNIADTPYNTQLFNRWNTIGWTNSTDTNAEGVATSIGSACKYTSSLNADGITYTTHTVGFTSNNHAVEKGEGYWVWVNTGVNWGRNS